jgi:uncharacterized repeat protein (TIGR03803 family)
MQKVSLRSVPAMLACIVLLAPIGCGGGGSGSSGPTSYTLGGTLAGLGAGESVSLQDNGGDTLTLNANGAFSFPTSLNTGSAYAATVQSHTPGVACSVSNGSGTVGSSDVTTINASCAAGTESILHSFGASGTDGNSPSAALILDNSGNLYGTTAGGGANGAGTVFKIDTTGTETIVYSFGESATDGGTPVAGLIMDSVGNFYGTTSRGGAHYAGTTFQISPAAAGAYTETILYSFGASSTDAEGPQAGLVMDSAGNLYGTTLGGGTIGNGTVFKVSPGASGTYTETILYSCGAPPEPGESSAGLIMDSAGNLYGTTEDGGANYGGTVFKLSPGASGTYTETVLHSFSTGPADGENPAASLIMDSAGNLYGTTESGGANYAGTVFKLSPGASGTYTETILYSFGASSTDAGEPHAGLIMDSAGNLYGTTYIGGAYNDGTVFKINLGASGAYTETILYSFGASATDGQNPVAGLAVDSAGNLYGTTNAGGVYGSPAKIEGTVFVID